MSENKGCYDEELDYYKTKCASLEEGLFKADRERAKLEKENEQLKQIAEEFIENKTQHNLWKLRTILKELKR